MDVNRLGTASACTNRGDKRCVGAIQWGMRQTAWQRRRGIVHTHNVEIPEEQAVPPKSDVASRALNAMRKGWRVATALGPVEELVFLKGSWRLPNPTGAMLGTCVSTVAFRSWSAWLAAEWNKCG
jgi:hypothetical protein